MLEKAGREVADIDLWEINGALCAGRHGVMDVFNLDHNKVNVNGGAIAWGIQSGKRCAYLNHTYLCFEITRC
ncbi:MAG: hypothetical protein CM1200mP10_27080 [Candidatus Neomarinimicrobiota bacterium]|nr:MAG: hypothetical protein CM1200mP10_27080 [Candidatus Neomarinimicrobiota bacterium]